MVPLSSISLFYIEADHLSTQSNQGSFFSRALSTEEEGRVQLWQEAVRPDSETKASYFLKISERKEKKREIKRGLGEAFAVITW